MFVNLEKTAAENVAREIAAWFNHRAVEVRMQTTLGKSLVCRPARLFTNKFLEGLDLLIILGGDGTLLSTAWVTAKRKIPNLGVNLGQLGFITELELDDLYTGLEHMVAGDYTEETRQMLEAIVWREGQAIKSFEGLNDIVLTHGGIARMIRLGVYVSGKYIDTYPADGVIVATPTGSTAYSLSAGGPILSPEVEAMIITPICPHTLHARPLVVSPNEVIRLVVRSAQPKVVLTVDGQDGVQLRLNDEVIVQKASISTKLIRLRNRSFYEILHEKLKEGRRTDRAPDLS